jgi:hypothetical protein
VIFRTKEVSEFWSGQEAHFQDYWTAVDTSLFDQAAEEIAKVQRVLDDKRAAVQESDSDELVNDYFLIAVTLDVLLHYARFWRALFQKKFSDSWVVLQDLQDDLRMVLYFSRSSDVHLLRFIEHQCGSLEGIYPYRLFCSMEMVHDSGECTICGKEVDDPECPHLLGELYRGKIAAARVRELKEIQAVSFVENPLDKRCVVKYADDSAHFKGPSYLLSLLVDQQSSVFRFAGVEHLKESIEVSSLRDVGRNDLCPCGSGRKFKKCCLEKGNVERDHLRFVCSRELLLNSDELVYLKPANLEKFKLSDGNN